MGTDSNNSPIPTGDKWTLSSFISVRQEIGNKSLIMDWQSPRNKWWMRLIAITLVIAFIHQDIAWATDGSLSWITDKNNNNQVNANSLANNTFKANNIQVPKDKASIQHVHQGDSNDQKTIINIQDAHSSLEAQESITKVLDTLVSNYDLKLIAIEGSSGYIDTSILKTFPDTKIRDKSAKELLSKGLMSAGEFYAITSDRDNIALYGIDDKSLYRDNLEEFRKVYEINLKINDDISKLVASLEEISSGIYSEDLKKFEANSIVSGNQKETFAMRWNYLNDLAMKLGIRYNGYPNLFKLNQ
jgi:hypothetical protein